MEDVFQTIEHITMSEEGYRTFSNPNLETSKPVIQVNEVYYDNAPQQHRTDHPNNGQPHPTQFIIISGKNSHPRGPLRKSPGQQA